MKIFIKMNIEEPSSYKKFKKKSPRSNLYQSNKVELSHAESKQKRRVVFDRQSTNQPMLKCLFDIIIFVQ